MSRTQQSYPAERLRDLLITLLGLTAGAMDATAFDRLGHVFASVITGNLILLGLSAEQANGRLALFSGCALASYGLGVVLGAPRHRRVPADERNDGALWSPGATTVLLLDLALLVGFAILWEVGGADPHRALQLIMLGLAAAAMGTQSSAVRRLGSFSTTYLTSTLTGVLEELVARRWSRSTTRSVAIILAAVAGAAGAIALITEVRPALPALPLVPLATVILTARRRLQS